MSRAAASIDDRGRPATSRARRKIAVSGAMAASLVCGLLIWAKLRLVTDIPRTAYATPERRVENAPADGRATGVKAEGVDPASATTAGVDTTGE